MKHEVARSGLAVSLGLAVIVPLLNYYRVSPIPSFYSELAAAFFFLAAGAASASLLPKRQAIDGFVAFFCVGLLALLGYQIVSGGYYEFMMSWASWAAFLCLFFLAAALGQLAASDQQLKTLIVDRLTVAFLLTALFNAFAQVAQVTEWARQIRPVVFIPSADLYASYTCAPAGNVAQLNHANAVAWLGMAGLLYVLLRRRVRLIPAIVGFAILLLSSALTSSRMAWLMAAALAATLVISRGSLGWSLRRALGVGGVLVFGLLVATFLRQIFVTGCPSSITRVVGGLGTGGVGHGLDYWIRLEMVRQVIMVWWSAPIAGVGVGKFMAKTFALEPSRDLVEPLDFYPHDTALEVLVSFGILGGTLLLICGAVWAVRVWRRRNATGDQWFLIAGLSILCVPAFLELALWYLYFLLPFGLMLGMAGGPVPSSAPSFSLRWRWLFPVAALVGVPILGYAALEHLHAEQVAWLGQLARTPSPIAGAAAAKVPKAARELTLFAVWGEHEALRFGEEKPEGLAGQMAANQRVLDNIPNPHIVARQVMLEALAGHPERARDLFRRMMIFFPEHYEPLAMELRKRAEARPAAAGTLLKILDEEMARPPRARGGATVHGLESSAAQSAN